MSEKISLFPPGLNPSPMKEITVEELVDMIRRPASEVVNILTTARSALEAGNDDRYDEIKKGLPAATFAGTFNHRRSEDLKDHSGLMPIDLDDLDPVQLEAAQEQLRSDPHVLFLFVSPSGEGLKGAVRMNVFPADDAEHKVAFESVRDYLESTHGLAIDGACKDVARLAFLSADKDCFYNPDAVPLNVEEWSVPPTEEPDLTAAELEVERLQAILTAGAITSITTPPPDCPVILQRKDGTILGEAGNLLTIEGLPKAGKSGVISALIGAAVGDDCGDCCDFLGVEVPVKGDVILHFDCEQSKKAHHRLISNAVNKRARLEEIPPNLKSFSLLHAEVTDRWPACEAAADVIIASGQRISIVLFDGGADLLLALNEEEGSRLLVATMHRFAQKHNCLVVVVIHENAGSDNGKTRGHFGSELWRKAQGCIGVEKGADGISAVYGKWLRDGDWPKCDAAHFKYSVSEGMHVTVDDPSADRKEVKATRKAAVLRALAAKVVIGRMTHTELQNVIKIEQRVQERTATNRIKEMLELGIITRGEDTRYERQN